MAQHLKDILLSKGLLWLPPDSSLQPTPNYDPLLELPSPEEAKYKVIVKAKVGRFAPHKQERSGTSVVPMMNESRSRFTSFREQSSPPLPPPQVLLSDSVITTTSRTTSTTSTSSGGGGGDSHHLNEGGEGEEVEATNIDELDDLVAIKGRKMKSLQESVDSKEVRRLLFLSFLFLLNE
jgi:hypothetical protein